MSIFKIIFYKIIFFGIIMVLLKLFIFGLQLVFWYVISSHIVFARSNFILILSVHLLDRLNIPPSSLEQKQEGGFLKVE